MNFKAPVRILVIEDDHQDFLLLREAVVKIDDNPFIFTQSKDIKEACHLLDDEDFDVILLDLNLPDSKGIESVQKIHLKRPRIPVVVLTGLDDNEVGLATVKKGAQDFLIKGQVSYDNFSKAIFYAIERARLENFRDDIVNNISHELRTPLTIVRECISQMNDGIFGEVNEKQEKYLAKSLTNIDRLRRIIDDLLDIAKIEEGKLELYKEKADLQEIIMERVADFSLQARNKNLELKTNIPLTLPPVLVDSDKIIQVFNNLISNAFKFTQEGMIEITVIENDQMIECRIVDTGCGIPAKDLNRVFSKFDQFSRTAGPGEKGTGLGLVISRGIIELHGGTISVASEEGKGTMFAFTLPKYFGDVEISDELKDLVQEALRKHNQFCLIKLNLSQTELEDQLTETIPDEFFSEIQQLIAESLYRQNDQVYNIGNSLYILLPNTEKENSIYVIERLQKVLQENGSLRSSPVMANDVMNALHHNAIAFPNDGLTLDELLFKSEITKGA